MRGGNDTLNKKGPVLIRRICAAALVIYSLFMLYLLFFRGRSKSVESPVVFGVDIKLIPFVTTSEFIEILISPQSRYAFRHAVRNLAGNVVLFIPYGFFLPFFFKRCLRYSKTLMFSALGISVIELTQLLTRRGICDIDDLILNLIGVSLGFALFFLWINLSRKTATAHNSDN